MKTKKSSIDIALWVAFLFILLTSSKSWNVIQQRSWIEVIIIFFSLAFYVFFIWIIFLFFFRDLGSKLKKYQRHILANLVVTSVLVLIHVFVVRKFPDVLMLLPEGSAVPPLTDKYYLAQRHLCTFLTQFATNHHISELLKEDLETQNVMYIRCVIVGDPLQVEPVVTMPEKLVTKLRNEHDVKVNWSPYKVSVQQLADRVSESGTYMRVGGSDEKIWTGFPLRTHRRCDDPMFTIANQIAYSNQMVKAVNENSTDKFIGASTWFHIENSSVPYNKHVVIEEIEVLKAKISELLQTGYKDEIYVISPFKSIANFCEQEFRSQKKISCGTIHKFQGKEADIVFLVLGSDPKSQGARNWASQKPNMLNVALTRAKKRFYVIGNRKLWASCDYFREMASGLG